MPPFYHELREPRGELGEGAGLVDAAEAHRCAAPQPEMDPAPLVPHRLDVPEIDPASRSAAELRHEVPSARQPAERRPSGSLQ